ncbi:hypothetical protein LBMAG56_23110 [Verrucomicrobiota bacterium]|nr:hypothetical protein LBMAG56_23110 [Verrucomicrobiota bacterium]
MLSDTAGNYSLQVPVGSYAVNALKPGYVTRFDLSANVTVAAAQVVTTNLALTVAPRTVSGRVTDAATTLGLAGVQMTFGGDGSQAGFALGFTDTNGNFSVPVPAGASGADVSEASLAVRGYVAPANATLFDTTAGNVTGLNIALSNATALVYGRLTNSLGQGIGGIRIKVRDQNRSAFGAVGVTTFADGSYTVGVLPGPVTFGPDTDDLMRLGLLPASANVLNGTLAVGGALLANLGAVPPTAHLRGRVLQDPGAGGVAGVRVYASPQNSGGSFDAQTAADGSFDVGVGAGVYYVGVSADDLSGLGLLASQLQLTVVDGVDQNNLVLAARTVTGQITGQVTGDGAPLGNVNVFASFTVNGTNFNANATTDGGGQFSLGVFNGTWQVGLSCNGSGGVGTLGFTCVNNQTVVINGANGTANFALTACGALQVTTTSAQLGGGQVGQFYNAQIQASGCGQSFSFSLSPGSGALPPGVNLFGNGNLSGTPTSSGTFNFSVRVTDNTSATADKAFSLIITGSSAPLQVDTTVLAEAQVGVVYSQQLAASGGQGTHGWSLNPGSLPLPGGLNLAGDGTISGTPTTPGTNYFSVRVTDGALATADQLLFIVVYPMLQMANPALPGGTVGVAYSTQVLVSGGHQFTTGGGAPNGYGSTFPNGSLPPGLNFSYGTVSSANQQFVISGTPTTTGTYPFTMGAYDASGFQVSRSFSITITASTLQITTTALTNALVGAAASYPLQASGGTLPYTWSIANGSQPLPSPLTLSSGGLISGTPAASGTFNFIVRLTDGVATSVTKSLVLTINSKPRLSAPGRVAGNQFAFTLTGDSGAKYRIEANTNVANLASWTNLGTNTATGGTFLFTDTTAPGLPRRFYRAVLVP